MPRFALPRWERVIALRRKPMVTDSLPAAVSEDQLWCAYVQCRDARLREQLVERYRRRAYVALKQLQCMGDKERAMTQTISPPALRLVRLPGEYGPILRCAGELSAATAEPLRRE